MSETNKRITQWDVAREAGVSRSQVSYVVSGDVAHNLSPQTRQKILDAIDKLGYHSNQSAQKLRLGIDEYVAKQIGLIISGPDTFSNPFLSQIIASFHSAAHQKGCKIHYIRFFDELKDTVLFNTLIHPDEIGGLLLLDLTKSVANDTNGIILEKIRSRMKNTVCVEWNNPLFSCVYYDKYKAGQLAVDHFFSRGYTRIGYTGPVDERLSGIRDQMTQNHLPVDGMIMQPAHTMEEGYLAAKTLFFQNKMPRALICGSDEVATGVISFCNKNKISIPEKLAIIGMGNSEISQFTNPPLTTLDIRSKEIGQTAIDMVTGGPYSKNSVLPAQIVMRKTS